MARKDQRKPISAILLSLSLSLLCTILNSLCTTSLKIVNHITLPAKQLKSQLAIYIIWIAMTLLTLEVASADGSLVQFEKTFGGEYPDMGRSVQQTKDGGYMIAGTKCFCTYGAEPPYQYNCYIVKTDPNGDVLWERTTGRDDRDEVVVGGEQLPDGDYIVANNTNDYPADIELHGADRNGIFWWRTTYGAGDWDTDVATASTGYSIVGYTYKYVGDPNIDILLINGSQYQDIYWEKTFGGSAEDYGYALDRTSDGGYIIAGVTNSFGYGRYDAYLIKTDLKGVFQWQKTFGGSDDDFAYSVQQTADGGYVVAGVTNSFGNKEVYLIRTDSNGNLLWQKTLGQGVGNSVQQTADGGFIIAGETSSLGAGGRDVYLIKTDESGKIERKIVIGGNADDYAYSVQQTVDGGYIVVGTTYSFGNGESDVYLIKIGPLQSIPGDVNQDGIVNFEDIAVIADHWLEGTMP
jgi:hypothetical protein